MGGTLYGGRDCRFRGSGFLFGGGLHSALKMDELPGVANHDLAPSIRVVARAVRVTL